MRHRQSPFSSSPLCYATATISLLVATGANSAFAQCAGDLSPPALNCAAPDPLIAGGDCTAEVPDLTTVPGFAASDACLPLTFEQYLLPAATPCPPGTPLPVGNHIISLIARDNSPNHNFSKCFVPVTVVDGTPPVLSGCPADDSVSCDAVPPPATVTANDNCNGSVTVTFSESPIAPPACGNYVITRTWTAVDAANNSSSCVQTITVTDSTAPTFTFCPSDANISCADSIDPISTGMATATDNCGTATVTYADGAPSGTIPCNYSFVRTFTATDPCGLSATCDQTITVTDTEAPVITCAGSITVNNDAGTCGAIVAPLAPATSLNMNFNANPPLGPSQTPVSGAFYWDRYRPFSFESAFFDGDYRLRHEINILDNNLNRPLPYSSGFYDTQGRQFELNANPIGSTLSIDLYVGADWETNRRRADLWGVTFDDPGQLPANISGYPIIGFVNDDATSANNRFRIYTQDVTNNPLGNAAGWIDLGLPAGFAYGQWYNLKIELTATSYIFTVTDVANPVNTLSYVDNVTYDSVILGNFIIQAYNFPAPDSTNYAVYWDNLIVTAGPSAAATATDNCDLAPTITGERSDALPLDAPFPAGCGPDGALTVITWTATDACNNQSFCTQEIRVIDNEPPVITCPGDAIANCGDSLDPSINLSLGMPTATDNCVGSITFQYSDSVTTPGICPATESFIRTWTATDACGNVSVTCDQLITIQDVTPPTITCPATATVSCSSEAIPANTGSATAADLCDATPAVDYSDAYTQFQGLNSPLGWLFFSQASARGSFVAGPATPPLGTGSLRMITGPGVGPLGGKAWMMTRNHTGTLLSNITTLSYSTYVDPATGTPSNIAPALNMYVDLDGNGTRDTTLVFEPVYVLGTQGPVVQGSWQTWDTLNGDGWWYTAAFGTLISPAGEYKPLSYYIAQYPNAKIVDWGGAPSFNIVVGQNSASPPWLNFIGNVDNVQFNSDTYDFDPDASVCGGTLVRTWTATDACGNTASCDQTINIVDTTAPSVDPLPAVSVECIVDVPAADINVVVASDNCGSIVVTHESDVDDGLTCPKTITRTYRATDLCGNFTDVVQTIVVDDQTAPVLSGCPINTSITSECDAIPAAPTVTAIDNCDGAVAVTYTQTPMAPPVGCQSYTIVRTWTATDACNNLTSCSQTITVQDTTLPVLVGVPGDATVECDNVPAPATVTATDNCGSATVTFGETGGPSSDCMNYTLMRTWTATDACGNAASATQTLTVQDTTPPSVNAPADITVLADLAQCAASAVTVGSATGGDDCDPSPDISGTRSDSLPLSDPYPVGITTVTWTATDACGNSSTDTQTVTVHQNPKLELVISDSCLGPGEFQTVQLWMRGLCAPDPAAAGFQAFLGYDPAQLQFDSWSYTPTPFAVPTRTTIGVVNPSPGEVDLSATICFGPCSPVYGDHLLATVTFQALMVTGSTQVTFRPDSFCCTTGITQVGGSPILPLTKQDAQSKLVDNQPPTISCPPTIALDCADATPAPYADRAAFESAGGTVSDNSEAFGESLVVAFVNDVSDGNYCPETITRTYTVTDCAGHSASCTQLITKDDTTPPGITAPGPISVDADAGLCSAVVASLGSPTVSDNCDPNPSVTAVRSDAQPLNAPYPSGVTTITWTATDRCGNSANAAQTVTVSGSNQLQVTVQLKNVSASMSRCISLTLVNTSTTASTTVQVYASFVSGIANFTVPVACGSYDCIEAIDPLHTLRRTTLLGISGVQYVASFTNGTNESLLSGNLNGDQVIDVFDFGVFIGQYNTIVGANTACGAPAPHSDSSGDGFVFTNDFTFIFDNFLTVRDPSCLGVQLHAPPGKTPQQAEPLPRPLESITVDELFNRGLGHLAIADLNNDGVVDRADMQAFLNGVRPAQSSNEPTIESIDVGSEGVERD